MQKEGGAILEREYERKMQRERGTSPLPLSPTFRAAEPDGSPRWIPAADGSHAEGKYDSDDDSEFTFVVRDSPSIAADEIFSNGQIRPVYPVFDRNLLSGNEKSNEPAAAADEDEEKSIRVPLRRLLIEEREACSRSGSTSSSSSVEELEGVPEGTYCVWNPRSEPPSPGRCKKSSSTGSSLRWRLRDLVSRSHSDGKERFVFLAADEKRVQSIPKGKAAAGEKGKKGKRVTEVDMVTAHRMMYGDGVAAAAAAAGGAARGQRAFLPYRRDLVGVFGNVNGISRTHHPY